MNLRSLTINNYYYYFSVSCLVKLWGQNVNKACLFIKQFNVGITDLDRRVVRGDDYESVYNV